jgi:hypothetical protein
MVLKTLAWESGDIGSKSNCHSQWSEFGASFFFASLVAAFPHFSDGLDSIILHSLPAVGFREWNALHKAVGRVLPGSRDGGNELDERGLLIQWLSLDIKDLG